MLLFPVGQIGHFFTPGTRLLGFQGDLFQRILDDEGPYLGKADV